MTVRFPWYYLLLAALPVAAWLRFTGHMGVALFIASCLGIVPLAGLMGQATEELASHFGQRIGGLLNATFGNATELIIAGFALSKGYFEVVKASITGSIVGNILLVLGLAMVCGGLSQMKRRAANGGAGERHEFVQRFNRESASVNASMLVLTVGSLMVPAVFGRTHGGMSPESMEHLSLILAGVLMLTYLMGLLFTLKTHRALFHDPSTLEALATWSKRKGYLVLGLSTAGVALLSEFLVGSIESATERLHLSEMFIGVIIIPIIGNAAEHSAAVAMAMKDKMDVSLSIAMGSSSQVALFVAPMLVFLGLAIGQRMDFSFEVTELVAIGLSVAIVNLLAQDGETHWFEGVGLLAMYALLAAGFYFVP